MSVGLEDPAVLSAIIFAGISVASSVGLMIYRFGRLEEKVNLLWDFIMRRGIVEARGKGFMRRGSDEIITAKGRAIFSTVLKKDLGVWYRKNGYHSLTDRDLMMALERDWNSILIEQICVPQNVSNGACLVLAMDICRESQKS